MAGLDSAGFESAAGFDSGVASGLAASAFDSAFAPGLGDALFRKSVTYQPLPFSWKPAAVSIFENVGFPHWVHTVSGASLTFCRNSCWCPQLSHRYS